MRTFKLVLFSMFISSVAFAQAMHAPINGVTTITAVTSTSRTQLPSLASAACSVVAVAANTGAVYVGGYTVTNASGANPGIKLNAGDALNNLSIQNSNWIYVAADTANDKVSWICN